MNIACLEAALLIPSILHLHHRDGLGGGDGDAREHDEGGKIWSSHGATKTKDKFR